MGRSVASMVPVWLVAVAGTVVIGVVSGELYLRWLPFVMAGCILLAFVIQLAIGRRAGLVNRLGGSLAGAFGVLVVATAIFAAVHPDGLRILT